MALCSSRRRDWASATRSRRSSVCRESREAERGPRAGERRRGLRPRKVGRRSGGCVCVLGVSGLPGCDGELEVGREPLMEWALVIGLGKNWVPGQGAPQRGVGGTCMASPWRRRGRRGRPPRSNAGARGGPAMLILMGALMLRDIRSSQVGVGWAEG